MQTNPPEVWQAENLERDNGMLFNVTDGGALPDGSHHILTREGIEEILNLQPRGSMA
jgi:hypothetical protein